MKFIDLSLLCTVVFFLGVFVGLRFGREGADPQVSYEQLMLRYRPRPRNARRRALGGLQ